MEGVLGVPEVPRALRVLGVEGVLGVPEVPRALWVLGVLGVEGVLGVLGVPRALWVLEVVRVESVLRVLGVEGLGVTAVPRVPSVLAVLGVEGVLEISKSSCILGVLRIRWVLEVRGVSEAEWVLDELKSLVAMGVLGFLGVENCKSERGKNGSWVKVINEYRLMGSIYMAGTHQLSLTGVAISQSHLHKTQIMAEQHALHSLTT